MPSAVRAWAASAKDPKLAEQARELAAEIDRVYAPRPFTQALDAAAKEAGRRCRAASRCCRRRERPSPRPAVPSSA